MHPRGDASEAADAGIEHRITQSKTGACAGSVESKQAEEAEGAEETLVEYEGANVYC
jgi:hypothetical protein